MSLQINSSCGQLTCYERLDGMAFSSIMFVSIIMEASHSHTHPFGGHMLACRLRVGASSSPHLALTPACILPRSCMWRPRVQTHHTAWTDILRCSQGVGGQCKCAWHALTPTRTLSCVHMLCSWYTQCLAVLIVTNIILKLSIQSMFSMSKCQGWIYLRDKKITTKLQSSNTK